MPPGSSSICWFVENESLWDFVTKGLVFAVLMVIPHKPEQLFHRLAYESVGLSVVSRVCHNSRSNSHPRTPD
jgi:hypothetical protein